MLEAKAFLLSPAELEVLISLKHTKEKAGSPKMQISRLHKDENLTSKDIAVIWTGKAAKNHLPLDILYPKEYSKHCYNKHSNYEGR